MLVERLLTFWRQARSTRSAQEMTDIVSPETSAVVEAVVAPAGSLEESAAVEASVTEPTTCGAAAEQATPSSEEGLTEAQAAEEDLARAREESTQNVNGVLQVCARSKPTCSASVACLSRSAQLGTVQTGQTRGLESAHNQEEIARGGRGRGHGRDRGACVVAMPYSLCS